MFDSTIHNRRVFGLLLLIFSSWLLVPVVAIELHQKTDMGTWGLSVFTQVILSLVAIGFTLIFIDPVLMRIQHKADSEREEQQLREQLTTKLNSRIEGVAAQASEELSRRGWLRDISFAGLNLAGANLNGATLVGANFAGGMFEGTSIQKADLRDANMEEAFLDACDLRGSDLTSANLKGVSLQQADLRQSFLDGVDLRGADLQNAQLEGASLKGAKVAWSVTSEDCVIFPPAKLDETTCLPDGTMWTSATDFNRFTDPQHLEFWKPRISKKAQLSSTLDADNSYSGSSL